jgi:phosphate:Na+ symporter
MNFTVAAIAAELFAGLGLFFVGVKLIGTHLKQITGRKIRNLIRWIVNTPVRGALLGVVAGALTQSTNAITFIMTSMTTAGLMTMQRAVPVVIWANLGTSVLVLLATIDLRLPVLYLIGVVGLFYYFDAEKSDRLKHPVAALLGLALLFQGLMLIKSGSVPLKEMASVRNLLELVADSYGLSFLTGAAITMVVQSSATVSVIAVAMIHSGLLTMDQTTLIIYGAGLGSGISLWFMTANMQGATRQLALLQILLKSVATLVLTSVFVAEHLWGTRLLVGGIEKLAGNIGLQAALIYLLYQLVGAITISLASAPALRLVTRLSPENTEESLAKPHYLYDQALDDIPSALELVTMEQSRLIGMLPDYLRSVDDPASMGTLARQVPADVLYRSNKTVSGRISEFLLSLMNGNADRHNLNAVLNMQARNKLIEDLQESLHQLNQALTDSPEADGRHTGDGPVPIRQSLAEAMHFMLMELRDANASRDADHMAILKELSADRAEMMEQMRTRIVRESGALPQHTLESVFLASSLFERIVWIIRQYSFLIPQDSPHAGQD